MLDIFQIEFQTFNSEGINLVYLIFPNVTRTKDRK